MDKQLSGHYCKMLVKEPERLGSRFTAWENNCPILLVEIWEQFMSLSLVLRGCLLTAKWHECLSQLQNVSHRDREAWVTFHSLGKQLPHPIGRDLGAVHVPVSGAQGMPAHPRGPCSCPIQLLEGPMYFSCDCHRCVGRPECLSTSSWIILTLFFTLHEC